MFFWQPLQEAAQQQAAGGGSVSLTATSIAIGAPVTGTPTLTQNHSLTATGIAIGAPVTGTPTISQFHVLTATGIAIGSPQVGSPFLDPPLVTGSPSNAVLMKTTGKGVNR